MERIKLEAGRAVQKVIAALTFRLPGPGGLRMLLLRCVSDDVEGVNSCLSSPSLQRLAFVVSHDSHLIFE